MGKSHRANGKRADAKNANKLDNIQLKRGHSQIFTNSDNELPAFHQKFSGKFIAIGLSMLMVIIFGSLLYYQSYHQAKLVRTSGIAALQEHIEQFQLLQKKRWIVEQLLLAEGSTNWITLYDQLIATDQQLLTLNTAHALIYKQWLNQNKAAEEAIRIIHKNQSRNQQLKQSSIIQLQLMLFTTNSILAKKAINEKNLYQQLQKDSLQDNVTQNRLQAYAKLTKQLHALNQLKVMLADVLLSFEKLSINTSQDNFELLGLGAEQIVTQARLCKTDNTKAITELLRQVSSFQRIVLTEQGALTKWQGYIQLAHSFYSDLQNQKHNIVTLLSTLKMKPVVSSHKLLNRLLAYYSLDLTNKKVSLILISLIGLFLFLFLFYLVRMRQQLKKTSEESLRLIIQSMSNATSDDVSANCTETDKIIKKIQVTTKSEYSEQNYQTQLSLEQIDKQKHVIVESAHKFDVKDRERKEQIAAQIDYELHAYKYLKDLTLQRLLQSHVAYFDDNSNKVIYTHAGESLKTSLEEIYQRLEQFELASYLRTNNAILQLEDVNFIEALQCVMLNKQVVFSNQNHQLYVSYDETIVANRTLDLALFEHMLNVLLDLIISQSNEAITLQLHIQLKDKHKGQQLIHFVFNIFTDQLTILPTAIGGLNQPCEENEMNTVLARVFALLLKFLHGGNILAQLVEGGYQLSFEVPLAVASANIVDESQIKEVNGAVLAKVALLTSNNVLVSTIRSQIEQHVLTFDVISGIDTFNCMFTTKYLSQHSLELLIVGSDMAEHNLAHVEQVIAHLPNSLQPKVMVLQSNKVSYQQFGFYSQAEQPLCQDNFIVNMAHILTTEQDNNLVLAPECFQQKQYQASGATVLLAVRFAQQYQNMQRLLQQLGLKVVMVCSEMSQKNHWQTGRYSLLLTEFSQHVFVEMLATPVTAIGVFYLSKQALGLANSDSNNKDLYDAWHCGQLSPQSSLSQLSHALSSWLIITEKAQSEPDIANKNNLNNALNENLPNDISDDLEDNELAINEVAVCTMPDITTQASFDFSCYLQHQGSVALALFMLDDYSQDNHQQLASLTEAIKIKELHQAQEAVKAMQLNAQILSSQDLLRQCQLWFELLSDSEAMAESKQVNLLLKDTQRILYAIDSYAETI
ncbi:MAG: hypothetical protein QF552_11960 [Litorilituus sp.]|jgi:hypothetical protein|nr:hypothetical protein [Litorilituus sp.]